LRENKPGTQPNQQTRIRQRKCKNADNDKDKAKLSSRACSPPPTNPPFHSNSGAGATAPATHIAGDIAIVDNPTLGTAPLSHFVCCLVKDMVFVKDVVFAMFEFG
jgi:hypothetical protein